MKVKELLSEETKWTKNHYAKNEEGEPVSSLFSEACCWCLKGAVTKCYYNPAIENYHVIQQEAVDKLRAAVKQLFPSRVNHPSRCEAATFNDHPETTFADIQKVLELADV